MITITEVSGSSGSGVDQTARDAAAAAQATANAAETPSGAQAKADAATSTHSTNPAAHIGSSQYEICLSWLNSANRDMFGTGATGVGNGGLNVQVKTGTTAGSRAAVCHGAGHGAILTPGSIASQIKADGNFLIRFLVGIDNAATDGVSRLVFGKKDTDPTGSLTFAGFGIEVRNRRLWAVAWDGQLRESDLGIDLTDGQARVVVMRRIATGFSVWVNGAVTPGLTCGAIGNLQSYSVHRAEAENRTSAAEHRVNYSGINWETWI